MTISAQNVTAASSIEGWEITGHLGPVFSHIVAGTGFLSDFTAGLSDIFGGRSGTYRRQLEALKSEAIAELLKEAYAKGANWIIALSVDFDEVAGQGKQMFMVTAMGVAVHAKRIRHQASSDADGTQLLSGERLVSRAAGRALIKRVKDGDRNLSPESWALARTEPTLALLEAFLDVALYRSQQKPEEKGRAIEEVADMAGGLDPKAATDLLYSYVGHERLAEIAARVIEVARLTSIQHIVAVIEASPRSRRWGLQTLRTAPRYVSARDIPALQILLANTATEFPDAFPLTAKYSILGSESKVWRCTCGKSVDVSDARCLDCDMDIKGFGKDMLKPMQLADVLRGWIEVLESETPTTDPDRVA